MLRSTAEMRVVWHAASSSGDADAFYKTVRSVLKLATGTCSIAKACTMRRSGGHMLRVALNVIESSVL